MSIRLIQGVMDMPPVDLDIFDREAENWWTKDTGLSSLKFLNPPRFKYFDRFVQRWEGLEALDIGCGGGFTSEFMAARGAKVAGIDLSKKSIEVARRHARETGFEIEYTHGRAEQLSYADNRFDAVVCVDVLEHVSEPGRVVSEAYRVLKPGGHFLFDTINKTFKAKFFMIWLLEYLLRRVPRGMHDADLFIPPERLVSILEETGFQEIYIKGFDVKGRDSKTKALKVEFNDNTSIFYIGKGVKR